MFKPPLWHRGGYLIARRNASAYFSVYVMNADSAPSRSLALAMAHIGCCDSLLLVRMNSGNELGPEAGMALVPALKDMSGLTSLDLSGTFWITHTQVSTRTAYAVG